MHTDPVPPDTDTSDSTAEPLAATGHARRQVLGTAAVVVAVSVPPFLVGALTTRIGREMEFGTGELGLALAACYTTTATFSPLAGRFVARIGAVAALRLAAALTTLALLGIATAAQPIHLIIAVACAGLPNALTQPSSNAILVRIQRPRLQALSFGLVQASIPTATLLAGAVLAVTSYRTGWREAILVVAALAVAAQFVLPRARGPRPVRRLVADPPPSAPARPVGGPALMIMLVLTGFLASASATSLPSFLATTGLASGTAVGLVVTAQIAGSLASVAVRVAAPVVTNRATLRQRLYTVAALLAVGVLAMLGIATETSVGFVLGGVAAFGFGWGWNALFNQVVALARPYRIAAATGLSQAGVFLGGTVGPLTFAAIARDQHFGAGWLAMAGLMSVAVLTALYAAHCTPRDPPTHRTEEVHP